MRWRLRGNNAAPGDDGFYCAACRCACNDRAPVISFDGVTQRNDRNNADPGDDGFYCAAHGSAHYARTIASFVICFDGIALRNDRCIGGVRYNSRPGGNSRARGNHT
jgi:hypothetical protein